MNGYYITIKNDLLDKKHHDAMGKAVWLYMWLIDKVTSIDEEGIGKVLGGKPVKQVDFENDLQLSRATYFRYVETLQNAGYIETTRTPYGLVFRVNKAKKIFGSNEKSVKKRMLKNDNSMRKSEYSVRKSEYSNKTIQLDNTIRQGFVGAYKTPDEMKMPDLGGY